MAYVVRLSSDIGELRVWLGTVLLGRALDEELLGRVRDAVNGCSGSLVAVVPASKVLNAWHMVYPAYLSLRDHLRGVSRFRDPGLGALTYMSGSTQLRRGLAVMGPIGHREVSIIIMGTGDCVVDAVNKVLDVLRGFATDMFVGVGSTRFYDGAFRSIEEFMDSLISEYLSGFT